MVARGQQADDLGLAPPPWFHLLLQASELQSAGVLGRAVASQEVTPPKLPALGAAVRCKQEARSCAQSAEQEQERNVQWQYFQGRMGQVPRTCVGKQGRRNQRSRKKRWLVSMCPGPDSWKAHAREQAAKARKCARGEGKGRGRETHDSILIYIFIF